MFNLYQLGSYFYGFFLAIDVNNVSWIFPSKVCQAKLYPHFGTSVLCGLRPSQLLHQHGAQVLWKRHTNMLRRIYMYVSVWSWLYTNLFKYINLLFSAKPSGGSVFMNSCCATKHC